MNIAVLGTGVVGRTLAAKLDELGHDVVLGTRDPDATASRTEPDYTGTAFADWYAEHQSVVLATFSDAGSHGEILFNALSGDASIEGLRACGEQNLSGKVLVDVANPLDFSAGMPPTLTISNTDSLGEQIQRAFPEAKVVKSLNTVTAMLMVNPKIIGGGDHDIFVSGNDEEAKATVTKILTEWFGWPRVVDLGDITTSRGVEMYLALWIRLMAAGGTIVFNLKLVR